MTRNSYIPADRWANRIAVTGWWLVLFGAAPAILVAQRAPVASGNPGTAPARYTPDESTNIRVYENGNRSVVNIQTRYAGLDPFFRPVTGEGSGSGWIYDMNGHVVTNYHVIEDSDRVVVTLFDGNSAVASVVGVDPQNDIAVLRIDVPDSSLIPLELGDSSHLKVGQKALAIGNPFGLERTLTVGIVSSLNRTLESQAARGRMIGSVIQIDAALNRGSSGGPLFDSSGQLVGMNTAIASANQMIAQNSGVGFAIPANTIRRVVPELISNGRIVRSTAGIYNVTDTPAGLMVVLVEPNGPAEKAGLRGAFSVVLRQRGGRLHVAGIRQNETPGDIVKAIDGVPVDSWDAMLDEIEKHPPGETVNLTILRGRKERNVPVTLTTDE